MENLQSIFRQLRVKLGVRTQIPARQVRALQPESF